MNQVNGHAHHFGIAARQDSFPHRNIVFQTYPNVAALRKDVAAVVDHFGDFNHGGTYSHHIVGCAAGLATLEYLKSEDLVAQAAINGKSLQDKLIAVLTPFEWVGDIRGLGLLWGVELVKERETKTPFEPDLLLGAKLCD